MADAGAVLGGRFELLRRIGAGGMSDVWEARDVASARAVAVKVLRGHAPEGLLEGEVLARLRHPHIVSVVGHGVVDDTAFVALELIQGIALGRVLELGQPLPWRTACRVVRDVLSALAHAHAHGVIHRDVKPSNIMVVDAGARSVLLDFGIAASVTTGADTRLAGVPGTPGFVAPEVATGAVATPAADVFAAGMVLYEALVGAPPFSAPDAAGLMALVVAGDVAPPRARERTIPVDVDALVMALLSPDPAARPTAQEAVATLNALLGDVAADAVTGTRPTGAHIIARCDFASVEFDPEARIVRMRRNAIPLTTAEDVGQIFWMFRTSFPPGRRAGVSLLTDMRVGPASADPRYERIVAGEIHHWLKGWRTVVALFASAAGVEQASRLASAAGITVFATTDEAAAEAALRASSP